MSSSLGGNLAPLRVKGSAEWDSPCFNHPCVQSLSTCNPHDLLPGGIVNPLNHAKLASIAFWAPGEGTQAQPQNKTCLAFLPNYLYSRASLSVSNGLPTHTFSLCSG